MSAARRFRIAAIPADGVGREVVAAGREVLDALAAGSGGAFAFDWQEFGWGCDYYARTGRMMAADGLAVLREFDAIYFGAVGWPGVPDHISLWGLRLAICQNFDQWANVRPVRFLPGVRSPLRKADDTELDWVVVRENSEGEYAGLGGRNLSARGPGSEVAVQSALFTEAGCERIMRFAFNLARTRTRQKVSSVTKSNAQQYGMVLWDDVFKRVAVDYPDVETESVLVDAMSAKFVLRPEDLSVVVASNLHADILSDLGSALAGSLGLAASANLNPERRFPSMFEPVHGSAPDIAGQGLANPIGAVGSAAMMLDHLGLPEQAARLHTAIEATTAAGVLTRDLGGAASTADVTKALIDALSPWVGARWIASPDHRRNRTCHRKRNHLRSRIIRRPLNDRRPRRRHRCGAAERDPRPESSGRWPAGPRPLPARSRRCGPSGPRSARSRWGPRKKSRSIAPGRRTSFPARH